MTMMRTRAMLLHLSKSLGFVDEVNARNLLKYTTLNLSLVFSSAQLNKIFEPLLTNLFGCQVKPLYRAQERVRRYQNR